EGEFAFASDKAKCFFPGAGFFVFTFRLFSAGSSGARGQVARPESSKGVCRVHALRRLRACHPEAPCYVFTAAAAAGGAASGFFSQTGSACRLEGAPPSGVRRGWTPAASKG